jgi:hypothetical protein
MYPFPPPTWVGSTVGIVIVTVGKRVGSVVGGVTTVGIVTVVSMVTTVGAVVGSVVGIMIVGSGVTGSRMYVGVTILPATGEMMMAASRHASTVIWSLGMVCFTLSRPARVILAERSIKKDGV